MLLRRAPRGALTPLRFAGPPAGRHDPGMRSASFRVACASVLLQLSVSLLPIAPLSAQKGVSEPGAGLECKPPKGWVELPADVDRHATLRLFAAPRALAAAGEGTHTPLLRVMWFTKGGDAGNDVVDGLPRQTPFRDLEDFMRRGFAAKDVAKVAGKVGASEGQRLTGKGIAGELVLLGQTVSMEGGEAALCFEVAANQLAKLEKELEATLASATVIPRQEVTPLLPPWRTDAEWAKKDAAARRAARTRWAEDVVAATLKRPGAGFKEGKSKYWTVLSAADAGFTKKVVAAAETARAWFAQKVPDLAKEAPLPAILRVFDSMDHYQAFLAAEVDQREYQGQRRELHFVNDKDNGGNGGYGQLLRAVWWQMLDDVDEDVLAALPRWFDNGCWEFLRSSRCDGKKLDFAPSDVERGRIDYQQRGKSMPALWDLMQELIQKSPENGKAEDNWGYTPECARLMRWFWIDDGLKAFDKPTLIGDYVRALATASKTVGPNPVRDAAMVGATADQVREVNKRFYVWRDAMLVAANNIAVPLPVDTWKSINEKWLAYNQNYK